MKQATELEIKTFELMKEKRFNEAYIMIALHNAQKDHPHGLGSVNWSEWAKKGLSEDQISAYQLAYGKPIKLSATLREFEDDIRAMSTLAYLRSIDYYVPFLFKRLSTEIGFNQKITHEMKKELYAAERNITRPLSSLIQLDSYKKISYGHYKVLPCGDDKVCEFCQAMNNKQFKIETAEIGTNCPPFHDLCRCTICPSC